MFMHATAQLPQNDGFVFRSTHEPAQFVRPPLHICTHVPAWHASPVPQTLSHAPQFISDEVRSTHAESHDVSPVAQLIVPWPGTQRCATQVKSMGQESLESQNNSSVREHAPLNASSARRLRPRHDRREDGLIAIR